MLISSTPPSVTYVYTGGSTYSVPFAFYGKETIKVSYSPPPTPGQLDIEPFIPMVYAIDYNVDGTLAGPHDGTDAFKYGSVTLTSAGRNKLSNGTKILVSRRTPAEQKFAYGELDNFPAKSHENALGHLTVVAQELRQDIVRTLQVPEGVADPQGVLSYLFDVAVRAEEELGSSLRIAENLNDLENKATARNNLGLGSAATRNIGNAAGQVLTAGSATISTSHPLAGGGALGNNLTLYINSATAATATANGSSGSVVYAADNNTNARNLAATPANVAKQVDDALTAFATRTISTTAPLMGGGNLTANRTLTISPATAATQTEPGEAGSVVYAADNNTTARNMAATPAGVAKQVNDAVVSAGSVPPGRTIATSAPLAGGGDLSANRTLSINAAGAATETANGTPGSVVYAAHNNKVAQNMAATPANVAKQIASLELGTAATRDVGTDSGNVMEVGAFGLGAPLAATDLQTVSAQPTGFYTTTLSTIITLPQDVGADGYLYNQVRVAAGPIAQAFQRYVHRVTGRIFTRMATNNEWGPWRETLHTGNILSTTGNSTEYPMSQKAVTDALNTKANTSALGTAATREVGTDSGNVMEVGAFGVGSTSPDTVALKDISEGVKGASSILKVYGDDADGFAGYGTAIRLSYSSSIASYIYVGNYGKVLGVRQDAGSKILEVIHEANLLTTTGQSTSYPMTQKAVTDALNTKSELGVGQTWQNVSRSVEVTYTNSTGKPIQVRVQLYYEHGSAKFYVDGLELMSSASQPSAVWAVIPPGSRYKVTGGFSRWVELR